MDVSGETSVTKTRNLRAEFGSSVPGESDWAGWWWVLGKQRLVLMLGKGRDWDWVEK